MPTLGCIYFVVNSQAYLKKCELSAISLKEHMPDVKTTLFTNIKDVISPCFDEVIVTGNPGYIWVYKYECLLKSTYDYTLHLDADTYVVDSFYDVFEMLDRFDLVLPLSVHYNSGKVSGVPDCFPELAGGLMVWKRCQITTEFLNKVLEAKKLKTKRSDEPFIRWAVYHMSELKIGVIPWEYNCVYAHPGYLFSKVKVMHGKRDTIQQDSELFNTQVYDGMPPFKRVYTGNKIFFFKKIDGTGGTKMEVVKEETYGNDNFVMAKGAG